MCGATARPAAARVGPGNANTAGEKNRTRLYHLESDPRREHNIAESQPDQLVRMQRSMIKKLEGIGAPPELLVRLGLDRIEAAK